MLHISNSNFIILTMIKQVFFGHVEKCNKNFFRWSEFHFCTIGITMNASCVCFRNLFLQSVQDHTKQKVFSCVLKVSKRVSRIVFCLFLRWLETLRGKATESTTALSAASSATDTWEVRNVLVLVLARP